MKKINLILFIVFTLFNLYLLKQTLSNSFLLSGMIFMFLLALLTFSLINTFKITTFSFFLLLLTIALHNLGTFGYYYNSPIFIPWDYLTHILAISSLTIIFFNYFKPQLNKKLFNPKNLILLITILLAMNGIGALVEINEYLSYVFFGLEDGSFIFGGADYEKITITEEVISKIEMHGGGWYDSMDDLMINLYTSITTLILCIIKFKFT